MHRDSLKPSYLYNGLRFLGPYLEDAPCVDPQGSWNPRRAPLKGGRGQRKGSLEILKWEEFGDPNQSHPDAQSKTLVQSGSSGIQSTPDVRTMWDPCVELRL